MALPEGVEVILAPNPSLMTGAGTNSYLVRDPASLSGVVVIDPGPQIDEHLDRIAQAAQAAGGLRAILITHGHADHVEGAAALRERTGALIHAWSREGSPVADRLLADDERVAVGGRTLRAIYTPGHRFDHLSFLLEDAGALFAGDLVAGAGTVVINPPEGDLFDYLASLRRLQALDLTQILPAHGPAAEQPRELLTYYIVHRQQREAQVIEALAGEPATISAMVAGVYVDVAPALHMLAQRSLLAHLLKLEREGRVVREPASATGEAATWRLA